MTSLATVTRPAKILTDGATLYWGDSTAGSLFSLPVAGGSPTTLFVAMPLQFASPIAVDATNLYFRSNELVYSLPKAGGTPTQVNGPTSVSPACTMRGGTLYWIEVESAASTVTLKSKALVGGSPTPLAALDVGLGSQYAIAVTSTAVFITDGQDIMRVPVGGLAAGQAIQRAPLGDGIYQLVADDTTAYGSMLGGIFTIADDLTTKFLVTNVTAADLATDATDLYFVDDVNAGSVQKIAKQGGTPILLAQQQRPEHLTVGDSAVYFTAVDGTIKSVPK